MTGKNTTKKGSTNYSLRALVPIPFDPKTDLDKDTSKLEQKTIEIPRDPDDEESEFIKQKYWVLREPHKDPETFAKWHVQVHELIAAKEATTLASQLAAAAKALLAGPALELFQAASLAVDATNTNLPPRSRWTDKQRLVKIFAHMARNVYHMDNAYIRQHTYLLYNTCMGEKFCVCEYVRWLKQLNNYLPMLPVEDGTPAVKLKEVQLRAIVERARPKRWDKHLLVHNFDVHNQTLDKVVTYFECLETLDNLRRSKKDNNSPSDTKPKKSKKKVGGNKRTQRDKDNNSGGKWCTLCKTSTHNTEDCWTKDKASGNHKKGNKHVNFRGSKGSSANQENHSMFSKEQFHAICQSLASSVGAANNKKRKVKTASDKEANYLTMLKQNNQSSVEEEDYFPAFSYAIGVLTPQKRKNSQWSTETVAKTEPVEVNNKPLRVLFDTGTSATIVLKPFVKKSHKQPTARSKTMWHTMGGTFQTTEKRYVKFKLPEFSLSKSIKWNCHVDSNTDPHTTNYDLIIGTNLMTELQLWMDFREKTMTWDDMTAPMESTNCTKEKKSHIAQHLYELSVEPNVLREAEDRQTCILAANYDQTDLSKFTKSLEHLNDHEQQNLLHVFEQYPTLFQGGLGKLNIPPIHLKIQPGKVPHHARPYPVPKAYKELTKNRN